MVRVMGKKPTASCQSIQSGSKCPKTDINRKRQSARYYRNPFLIFLQQFRGNDKAHRYKMSAFESSAVAGHLWQRMTDAERTPYVRLAHQFNYTYKSRNRKVNWVLRKIRQIMADGKLQLHYMWLLASKMLSWNESIMTKVFGLDDHTIDYCDDYVKTELQ